MEPFDFPHGKCIGHPQRTGTHSKGPLKAGLILFVVIRYGGGFV